MIIPFPASKFAIKTFTIEETVPSLSTLDTDHDIGAGWDLAIATLSLISSASSAERSRMAIQIQAYKSEDGRGEARSSKVTQTTFYDGATKLPVTINNYMIINRAFLAGDTILTNNEQGTVTGVRIVDSYIDGENLTIEWEKTTSGDGDIDYYLHVLCLKRKVTNE